MSKVLKRKPNSHVVCIDPKKKNTPKKPPTKADLVQELKSLKNLNEALEENNKKNMEKILFLEKKVSSLQNERSVQMVESGCQTADEDLLFCEECEFPAETLYELGEHTGEFHTGLRIPCDFCSDIYTTKENLTVHEMDVHKGELDKRDQENALERNQENESFKCKFCDKMFHFKRELMIHSSHMHKENVAMCWNFQTGWCDYQNDCWFSHEEKEETIKCNFCETMFSNKADLYKHRKECHTEHVSTCNFYENGTCAYNDQSCWFIHHNENASKEHDNIENNKNEDNESKCIQKEDKFLIKSLIEMVEKLTYRMVQLEANQK